MRRCLLSFLLSTVALTAGAAERDVVIPHGPDAPSSVSMRPFLHDWNRRTMVAIFAGEPDQPGKAEALKALTLAEGAWSNDWPNEEIPTKGIREAARAARAAGSTDAMLLYLLARFEITPPEKRAVLYQDAATALAASGYPVFRRAVCDVHACDNLQRVKEFDLTAFSETRDEAETLLMKALGEMPDDERGAAGLYDSVVQLLQMKHVLEDPIVAKRMLRDLESQPMPDWWRNALLGSAHLQLAWLARGHDWADKVTDEGWKGFHEHLVVARTHLVLAWKQHPDRPQPAVDLIQVAMAGETADGDPQAWFERAVAAQVDCYPAYVNIYSALQPRWGGSYERILAIGTAAADTGRYDTDAPWQYINAVRTIAIDASRMQLPPQAIIRKQAVYDRCRAIMAKYLEQHPDREVFYASHLAVLAWMCGLPGECAKQLDIAGAQVQREAFVGLGMTPKQLRDLVDGEARPADPKSDAGADF